MHTLKLQYLMLEEITINAHIKAQVSQLLAD